MKEKKIRFLLQKSIVETSDGFVDRLLHRLEAKEVIEKPFVWSFTPILSGLIVAMLALSFAFYKYLKSGATLFDTGVEIGRAPIFSVSTVLLLLAINYVLKLTETYNISKSNTNSF